MWSVAGLSILALDDSNRRRTLALYLLARLGQCAYNSEKFKKNFLLWRNHLRHGDSLLFSLACAQVMYAFVMRPESLPKSYRDCIQKTGPVAAPIYKAVRDCCRGSPVDIASLSFYLSNRRVSTSVKLEEFPSVIPCSMIHPDTNSCLAHNVYATSATFRKTFPLYFSLTFVPFVVLRLQKGVICLHRKVASKDHKLVYWVAGGIAALSVLLEKKARRGELALYVLPRAVDSWWYILVNRHLLPDIKNAETKDGINSNSWQAQPIGICHKLYNFIINTLFWPPLKRVTMGRTPNSDTDGEILLHDVSRKGEESSEIVVEFRHSTEDWSSKVDNLNAELGKQKTENDDQMARIGIMKPQVQGTSSAGEFEATSTNVDALKGKGPKNTVTIKKHDQKDRDRQQQQQQQQDKNIPTTVSSVESEFVRKPRLLGVTSNINEKSGAFIESRLKAMRKNFTFETNQS